MDFIEKALALAVGQKQESRNLIPGELDALLVIMRSMVPIEGDTWKSAHLVVVQPGREITEHAHDEAICLFYAEPAGAPIIVAGRSVLPSAGDVYVLPPTVRHSVVLNATGTLRVSVAMKVEKNGNSSTKDRGCYPSGPIPLRNMGDTYLG